MRDFARPRYFTPYEAAQYGLIDTVRCLWGHLVGSTMRTGRRQGMQVVLGGWRSCKVWWAAQACAARRGRHAITLAPIQY